MTQQDQDLWLGLAADGEEPPGSGHRGTRLSTRGRLVVAAALLVAVALVATAGLLGVRAVARFLSPGADYRGEGSGRVVVQVRTGDTASDIAQTLVDAGVVKSADAFRRAAANDDRSRGIQPGYYQLRRELPASAALALLLDPAARVSSKVTVPEGTRLEEVLSIIEENARIPLADLRAAARPGALRLPRACGGQLEGCLFPATYSWPPGTTAADALADMVERFREAAEDVRLDAGARGLGRSAYDVLIIASLLEREARFEGDYPKVARVIYNRLAGNMPLQLDSTINYALRANKTRISIADTRIASRYNTYRHAGLPPTPINSPGMTALQAALHPARGSWLYFVTIDKAGHNAFATTYDEFLTYKAIGARNR